MYRRPGPAWVEGLGSRQQPGWDEHAKFMDGLYADGRVLLGGPLDDFSRIVLVVSANDERDAAGLLAADPWTPTGVLETDEVRRWSIYLGPDEWRDTSS